MTNFFLSINKIQMIGFYYYVQNFVKKKKKDVSLKKIITNKQFWQQVGFEKKSTAGIMLFVWTFNLKVRIFT